jgi:TPR repeat protein
VRLLAAYTMLGFGCETDARLPRDCTYVLGICYLNGDGVPEDPEFGIHLLRKAATKGHAGAASDLETLNA